MSQPEPATTPLAVEETGVGSVFVSNYPPFSFWNGDSLPAVERALDTPGDPATPFGLYLHIPFCRKRCKFCYFRVYTDKNAREIGRYLDALGARGRPLRRAAGAGRPPAGLRLLRRRHAVLHQRQAPGTAARPAAPGLRLGQPASRRSPSSASPAR